MKVYDVTDQRFAVYGRVVDGFDFGGVIGLMKNLPIPEEVVYTAASPDLEALPVFKEFETRFYGQMGAQLGYCMGHNDRLNALEYHRGSEVNIAVTDYIAFVGRQTDIEPGMRYDTAKVEAFYVHAGMAVEFYATTLHYGRGRAPAGEKQMADRAPGGRARRCCPEGALRPQLDDG